MSNMQMHTLPQPDSGDHPLNISVQRADAPPYSELPTGQNKDEIQHNEISIDLLLAAQDEKATKRRPRFCIVYPLVGIVEVLALLAFALFCI